MTGQGQTRQHPTRWSAAVFAGKVAVLQIRRGVLDACAGPARLAQSGRIGPGAVVAASSTPLWPDARRAESAHQLGKVHNLRRAARLLDGVVIPAGSTFSFWRQLGRATRARGFVTGRMLQQGCMVPATGGGLCQLSNALYDVALQAGCEIVERHAHSRQVPGSAAMHGRDATVAWNYVDLRFRPARDVQLSVALTGQDLVVRLHGAPAARPSVPDPSMPDHRPSAQACDTCATAACFRHAPGLAGHTGRQAILVDEAWPEFIEHIAGLRGEDCDLGLPLAAAWMRPARHAWPTDGFATVRSAPAASWQRSVSLRLTRPGAPRRQAEAAGAARLARSLAPLLTPDVTSIWVAQSFLPALWRDGHLGGRQVSVLMTRPPMHLLQARLDAAFAAHPDRATLADFRADPDLVAWEAEALAQACSIATPHPEIAAMFPGRAQLLDWIGPKPLRIDRPGRLSRRIAFPGPTLARKGAFEVRAAARALDLEVLLLGAELEGACFWDGVRTSRPDPAAGPAGWLADVMAVVQPALVEEQPRRLLAARAAGVPVLATAACGLTGPGVIAVEPLDAAALGAALQRLAEG